MDLNKNKANGLKECARVTYVDFAIFFVKVSVLLIEFFLFSDSKLDITKEIFSNQPIIKTMSLNTPQDYIRLRKQITQDLNALRQRPQQYNDLCQRLRANEPGASDEILLLQDETERLKSKTHENLKIFTDSNSDRFAENKRQKISEQTNFKETFEAVVEAIKNAQNNMIKANKEAYNSYNSSRQLVNFNDEDDANDENLLNSGNANSNPFATTSANTMSNPLSSTGGHTQQTQASVQMERDMAKRQQAMEAIERDVSNVNMIYKELNTLVYQQADIVDNIENHIDTADVEVQDGVHQLSQAATHAVSYRRKKFCLFMFCVAAILTVILILIISMSTGNDN